jgi:hypothetical protein
MKNCKTYQAIGVEIMVAFMTNLKWTVTLTHMHWLGSNCTALNWTGGSCSILPFSNWYHPIADVAVVTAAMAYDDPG